MLLEIDEVVLARDLIERIEKRDESARREAMSIVANLELYMHNYVPPEDWGDVEVVNVRWLKRHRIIQGVVLDPADP